MEHGDHGTPRMGAFLHLRGNGIDKGDPVALPLVQSSMYHLPGAPDGSNSYGRADNPTWVALEHALEHLEGAPCRVFPSGMGAISAALFATLKAGQRLLIPADGYYVTRLLADRYLRPLGVSVEERPTTGFAEGGFSDIDVVFLETPSNPGLDLIDLAAVAGAVRAAGGITICDNTTMTPLGQRPLDLGIDIAVASDTKAMAGHSDLLLGHVASSDAGLVQAVEDWRRISGAIPGPHEAWLLHRGLETLEVRFDRMCRNAEALAPRLAEHRAVSALRYPGLQGDPAHNLARAQMQRFGFLLSLDLGSEEKAERFINDCPLLRPATSFGGVHSSAERRARWGDAVAPGFVRLSVGCEPVEELWRALRDALDTL